MLTASNFMPSSKARLDNGRELLTKHSAGTLSAFVSAK